MSAARPSHNSHARRIAVIACHAFTQLMRMKVFYFLMVFAVIALGSNFFDLPQHSGPETMGLNVLRAVQSWSVGTMTLFAVVLGIVATALLLPKDVEDRTLYTILAKPVPRLDYLAGKLLGVLLLLFVSLALMDLLMLAVLQLRVALFTAQLDEYAAAGGAADMVAASRAQLAANGPSWSLQGAVFAVFLKASIMASLALFISTFSSSTLFTTIVSFLIFFVGHFQADARAILFDGPGSGWLARGAALLIALVLPDFQLFKVVDEVLQGVAMPLELLGKLTGMAAFYAGFFILASWYVFSDKEF
ncbi:MAG: hypothetical protein RLZZ522_473 [Verrucomicrobiota bacterium]